MISPGESAAISARAVAARVGRMRMSMRHQPTVGTIFAFALAEVSKVYTQRRGRGLGARVRGKWEER